MASTSPFDFNNMLSQREPASKSPKSPPAGNSATSKDVSGPPMSGHRAGNVTVYQTTGPDAHKAAILSPETGLPALNPRSCVTCRRRKVRCDKQMPCSNCRRGRIPCVFPAPGRAPRRPKDPNQPPKNTSQREAELVKRLRKLEGIVEELSEQVEVESGGGFDSPGPDGASGLTGSGRSSVSGLQRQSSGNMEAGASSKSADGASDGADGSKRGQFHKKFGRLILNDPKPSAKYVSNGFWSKLNDELDAIREETQKITDDDSDSDYEDTPSDSTSLFTSDHHGFILGYRSTDVNLQQCHPSPSQIPFLWSVYQENVDPLIKVIHVPSIEILLREARKNVTSLTPGNEALVFAIYFGAVVSLEPEEVQANLGVTKDALVGRYRFALEQALARTNFLHQPDIPSVQAFTIFLTAVRREDDTKFCWTLVGLLIRLAQGMGLHRDGSQLKLSPFETEIRRRLWWAILLLDVRAAEELGTDLIIGYRGYDTEMPGNFNDSDLEVDATKMPESREGRSDSAVSILRFEICSTVRRFLLAGTAMAYASQDPPDEDSISDREALLIEVYERVENRFLKHLANETDSLYWAAAMLARIIMGKMCLVLYQPLLFSKSDEKLTDEIRQRAYVAAIEVTEYGQRLNMDPRCKQYHWLFRTYTTWHAVAYTLIETCRRPWTALVERGWQAVTSHPRTAFDAKPSSDQSALFLPLRKLYLRARKHRTAEIARLRSSPEEARKLDFAERVNPVMSRFAPVPGSESHMERIREGWRRLVWPDRATGTENGRDQPDSAYQDQSFMSGETPPATSDSLRPQGQPDMAPSPGAMQMDLSNAAMEFMDNFMSNPNAVEMASFWPISDTAIDVSRSTGLSAETLLSPAYPDPQHSRGPHQHQQHNNGTMSQGNMPSMQQQTQASPTSADQDIPPFLWSHSFPTDNSKMNDGSGGADMDMLDDSFDWHNWSQNIRGMEMGSTQNYKPF